ncbi:MAG: hypothetical protein JWL96_1542 [Sphingomonas bacterium]|uniref:hypothetical protein n=1 Tax=Sphingomonas bacterium TaxID=1895847 RepID=UPI002609CD1B|nr:hypothetical protein [Sphingomonas bacterium]MDB5709472.1 hypothetical protein [Sphingomonas bacterium]
MKPSPIIQTAWRLLDLILQEEPPSDAALAEALDELALAYHGTPEGAPAPSNQDPPARDSAALFAIIAARFPDYGVYAIADPLDPSPASLGTGDAIDDLLDIAGDMAEAVWRFDHLGADDAHWYLRLLHFHWGRHLRELSLYLHARRFG